MARRARQTVAEHGPHPIDVHVGKRLRVWRTMRGMSLTTLGESVGLPYQQVQRYEHGANRVSASRLYQFACLLDVPIGYFFEDVEAGKDEDVSTKRETLELVRAYYRIESVKARKQILHLVKTIASVSDED